jgi:hypothetical protein
MTRVTYVCSYSAWKVYHLCVRPRAVQCGPLEVRNRSQAYTVLGQGTAMRTCDGQRVKELQHRLVKDLKPAFVEAALRHGASSTMHSDRVRLLYVSFRFGFGSSVRLHILVLNLNVIYVSFRPSLATRDFF